MCLLEDVLTNRYGVDICKLLRLKFPEPCIVIYRCNENRQNGRFLHYCSYLIVASSTCFGHPSVLHQEDLCMLFYGISFTHPYKQSGRWQDVHQTHPIDQTALTFSHHASYIYRTDVPLIPRVRFSYIQSINIFNYFFQTFSRHLRLFLHKMSCIS
jgi:hypothetical protein